jgi:hypothetical protein
MAIGKLISSAVVGPSVLKLEWDDGRNGQVDLADVISSHPGLKSIRSAKGFANAAMSEDGWSVEWPDGIDFGAPQLRRWLDEQEGEAMPANEFREWMTKFDLTLDSAAEALGLSRRMIAYYSSGEKAIPKTVLLATQGWQTRRDVLRRRTAIKKARFNQKYGPKGALATNFEASILEKESSRIVRESPTGRFVPVKEAKSRQAAVAERLPKRDVGRGKKRK